MDSTDIGFKLLIENTLRDIKSPEHRHLVIETITIIATGMTLNARHMGLAFGTLLVGSVGGNPTLTPRVTKIVFSFETEPRIEVQPSGRH